MDFGKDLAAVYFERALSPTGLILKPLTVAHAPELFTVTECNRTYLRKWLPWLDTCKTQEDSLQFITNVRHQVLTNTALVFGIFYQNGIVGVVGFNEVDLSSKSALIGYWIAEKYQGQGLVTHACSKLVSLGFEELELLKITIKCAVENVKSRNIPIRLGFMEIELESNGENLYGTFVDIVVYSKTLEHWAQRQQV